MVGQYIMGFCRLEIAHKLKKIETSVVKTGWRNRMGNKGAAIIRFNLDDTSLFFANCHLESGHSKLKERVAQFDYITKQAFRDSEVVYRYSFDKHDVKVMFGDLNFRLDMDYEPA